MDLVESTMQNLFAQLGEDSDERSIARFIEQHGPLHGHTRLHEAPFWSPAQAAFLRDAIVDDADWAPVVDALNARLHNAQAPGGGPGASPGTKPGDQPGNGPTGLATGMPA
jgi:hypothetical protein